MAALRFEWAGWTFEPAEWRLTGPAGDAVALPNRTLDLLALLLDRAPGLVSKEEILSTVWKDTVVEEGNIAFHIASLRKTLDQPDADSCIETVRGRGYRFVTAVTRTDPVSGADETAAPTRDRWWRPLAAVVTVGVVAAALWWANGPARAPAESQRATTTAVSEAQALTVEGRTLWRLRTPSDVQQAIRLYERAIALDPTYAPAYAGLADAYNLTMSGLPPSVRYPRAREAAERAVALDPDLAEGHTALAFLRYKFEWRWDDAEREFQRALALDPDYAQARHWYGEFLALLRRFDESLAQLRRAIELEPDAYPIQSDLIPPLLLTGQSAEARAVVEAIAARSPNWHFIPYRLAEIYQAEGRDREAAEQHWRWMMLTGSSLQAVDRLRTAFDEGGRVAMTRAEIEDLLAIESATPGAWMVATNLSRAYARIGDRASALRWLDLAIDRREDAAISLLVHPDYDLIRSDPAFRERISRVGLPLPPQ